MKEIYDDATDYKPRIEIYEKQQREHSNNYCSADNSYEINEYYSHLHRLEDPNFETNSNSTHNSST